MLKFVNFVDLVLQANAGLADTTLALGAEAVTDLPALGVNEEIRLVLFDGVQEPEIIEVTAIDGAGNVTATRALEGTTARDWIAGTRVRAGITAGILDLAIASTVVQTKYGTGTFATNRYTVTVDSITDLPVLGQLVAFLAPAANTGATTLRFTDGANFTSDYTLRYNGISLVATDIKANQLVVAVFTGTVFELFALTNKLTPLTGAITAPAFIVAGSTSVPSIGAYAVGGTIYAIATGAIGRFYVSAAGNIGIGPGHNAPTTILHVKSASPDLLVEASSGEAKLTLEGSAQTMVLETLAAGWRLVLNGVTVVENLAKRFGIGQTSSADAALAIYGEPTGAAQFGLVLQSRMSGTSTSIGQLFASTLADTIAATQFIQAYIKDIVLGVGATVTNAIGLYIEAVTAGTTKNWQIYSEGANASFFNGSLYIGNNAPVSDTVKGVNFGQQTLGYYQEGTWTPADASGAGLVFPVATGRFTRIGRLVYIQATVQYPVTANANTAFILGLPFTSANTDDNEQGHLVNHTGATATRLYVVKNNTTVAPCTVTKGAVTNAQMSGTTSFFNAWYIAA